MGALQQIIKMHRCQPILDKKIIFPIADIGKKNLRLSRIAWLTDEDFPAWMSGWEDI